MSSSKANPMLRRIEDLTTPDPELVEELTEQSVRLAQLATSVRYHLDLGGGDIRWDVILGDLHQLGEVTEELTAGTALAARQHGYTWAIIGEFLDITKQGAAQLVGRTLGQRSTARGK